MPAPAVIASEAFVADVFNDPGFTPDTTDVVPGDLMIVAIGWGQNTDNSVVTEPSGWADLDAQVEMTADVWRWEIVWKIADGVAPTENFTFSSTNEPHRAVFLAVRGDFDPDEPFGTPEATVNDNDGTCSLQVVEYVEDDLVLNFFMAINFSSAIDVTSNPSGFAQVEEARNGSVNIMGATCHVSQLEATEAGDTTGLTVVTSHGANASRNVTVTVPNVAGGGGGGAGGMAGQLLTCAIC
jgi:hypothetical protein